MLTWVAVCSSSTSTCRGGVAQKAEQLGLRLDLGGHQVEDGDFQGADILSHGPLVGHDEDIFGLQHLNGGQVGLNPDGHRVTALSIYRDGKRCGHKRGRF